jgi:hypothetical protein
LGLFGRPISRWIYQGVARIKGTPVFAFGLIGRYGIFRGEEWVYYGIKSSRQEVLPEYFYGYGGRFF